MNTATPITFIPAAPGSGKLFRRIRKDHGTHRRGRWHRVLRAAWLAGIREWRKV